MYISKDYQDLEVLRGIYQRDFVIRHNAHVARTIKMRNFKYATHMDNLRILEERRRNQG